MGSALDPSACKRVTLSSSAKFLLAWEGGPEDRGGQGHSLGRPMVTFKVVSDVTMSSKIGLGINQKITGKRTGKRFYWTTTKIHLPVKLLAQNWKFTHLPTW